MDVYFQFFGVLLQDLIKMIPQAIKLSQLAEEKHFGEHAASASSDRLCSLKIICYMQRVFLLLLKYGKISNLHSDQEYVMICIARDLMFFSGSDQTSGLNSKRLEGCGFLNTDSNMQKLCRVICEKFESLKND